MKLSSNALEMIDKPAVRIRLALALDVTEQTVIRYIKGNKPELTQAAALRVIREETGLTDEQILETVAA